MANPEQLAILKRGKFIRTSGVMSRAQSLLRLICGT
jgi:hypothetical protein